MVLGKPIIVSDFSFITFFALHHHRIVHEIQEIKWNAIQNVILNFYKLHCELFLDSIPNNVRNFVAWLGISLKVFGTALDVTYQFWNCQDSCQIKKMWILTFINNIWQVLVSHKIFIWNLFLQWLKTRFEIIGKMQHFAYHNFYCWMH